MIPIIWPYTGINWYDLSGDKPQSVLDDRTDRPAGQCEGITWWKGKYLLTTLHNKLRLISPDDLGKTWTEIDNGCSGVPTVNGNIIALSHRCNGDVQVFRMTETSANLIPQRSFKTIPGLPERVVFFKGRMLVPCGYHGLLVETLANTKIKS